MCMINRRRNVAEGVCWTSNRAGMKNGLCVPKLSANSYGLLLSGCPKSTMGYNSYDDTTTSCFFLYDFILCPLQLTSHLPLDICCWLWYIPANDLQAPDIRNDLHQIYYICPLGWYHYNHFLYFLFTCLCNLEIPVDMTTQRTLYLDLGCMNFCI